MTVRPIDLINMMTLIKSNRLDNSDQLIGLIGRVDQKGGGGLVNA